MPIRIPDALPAAAQLESENIFVMTEYRALHQDIRPLRVLVLNLMPKKIETECQFLRLLSNTPLQVSVEFLHVSSHISKNTSQNHLATFYRTFSEIRDQYYDGCIITGAPVEHLKFEDVDYWNEICDIMEWTKSHVFSTLHICWAALAGLYYHFDIPKYDLAQKMFGVFPQHVLEPHCQLLRGFNDVFHAPHSRHAEVHREDIEKVEQLKILTESPLSGVLYFLVIWATRRIFFSTRISLALLSPLYKRSRISFSSSADNGFSKLFKERHPRHTFIYFMCRSAFYCFS
mgnify:CR=1 FL=1